MQALEARLRGRGKDSEGQIELRLRHARHELDLYHAYDYLIVNDDLDRAYRHFESVIWARREHMFAVAQAILKDFPVGKP